MPNLTQLANHFQSDKGAHWSFRHKYTYLYDLIFWPYRDAPIDFLELGLAVGGPETIYGQRERMVGSPSVAMWLEYFRAATIHGFDISDFSHLRHERFRFVRGDSGVEADLQRLTQSSAKFDIVVDDASHASYHQQLALKTLWPRVAPGGLYVIEDLHWQSPVFEALIPGTPKTAEAFAALYERGVYLPNPILSEAELAAAKEETAVYSMLPGLNGAPSGAKLLILQKKM